LPLFGVPADGIALLLAADTFIDMGRTVTNVIGNSIACAVIAKFEAKRAARRELQAVTAEDSHDHGDPAHILS
jgi:Na+/H+-dicarboxylate symporter